MFGWFNGEEARASCSNRARRSRLSANSAGRTFTATSRPSRVSRARYTSPMPPAPIGATISYGPSFVPVASVMPVFPPLPSPGAFEDEEIARLSETRVDVRLLVGREAHRRDFADSRPVARTDLADQH